ncbi:MAG: hypothetical protein WBB23_19990 [Desulforhopalus sp.]
MKKQILLYTMAITLFLQTGPAFSINAPKGFRFEGTSPTPVEEQEQKQYQKKNDGVQLITEKERAEFLARMRAAKTDEEQKQIRLEIYKIMQERARSRGFSLPGRSAEP